MPTHFIWHTIGCFASDVNTQRTGMAKYALTHAAVARRGITVAQLWPIRGSEVARTCINLHPPRYPHGVVLSLRM